VLNNSVFPSFFSCFCALSFPLSLPFDATGPLSVLSSRRRLAVADINPIAIKSLCKRLDVQNEGDFW
jgi:hypothetical protein